MKQTLWAALAAVLLVISGCAGGYDAAGSAEQATPSSVAEANPAEAKLASNPGVLENIGELKANLAKRSVIRSGDLSVLVESAQKAERSVNAKVDAWGGYVERCQTSDLAGSQPRITLLVRVPANLFEQALDAFADLGTLESKSIQSEDVTSKLVDVDARLATMRATEEAMRRAIRESRSAAEIATLKDQAHKLRVDIESVAAQRKAIGSLAVLSKIEVKLVQRANPSGVGDPNWAKEAWAGSLSSASALGKGLGAMAIYAVTYSPFWGPVLWLAVHLSRKAVAKKRERFKPATAQSWFEV
ncbi:MAG: DUF4349 domain-containing protein [Armatimonadetes bacterium]|nr:DUF4349 domain-containing protein [Armatimonadota bacterium]